MKKNFPAAPLLLAALSVTALAGCSSSSSSSDSLEPYYPEPRPPQECRTLLNQTMDHVRAGERSDRVNDEVALLSEVCPSEMDVFTSYAASSDMPFDVYCNEIASSTDPEALVMLRQDGHCKGGTAPGAVPAGGWPQGGLGWDSARDYAGTYQRICGPVTSVRNTYDGGFVNVGLDYPDTGRFTFIMWGVQLEAIAPGTTVCAAGNIYLYEGGVAQMEPAELETWK
ncbi:hypothetical protein LJ754_16300 [Arthrobacter sp. zg-Y40]|uniref:hypothetical protein n=1 Tax=Arthrobacter sp. zg-Y40 TaxID=2886939 RepID=UPI001D148610|nr:hypothetical protein [Arthrobacter sp. zg-Y40]MCC3280709.1 hypothetical protein [Arthrobacter sp. zg-Y40]